MRSCKICASGDVGGGHRCPVLRVVLLDRRSARPDQHWKQSVRPSAARILCGVRDVVEARHVNEKGGRHLWRPFSAVLCYVVDMMRGSSNNRAITRRFIRAAKKIRSEQSGAAVPGAIADERGPVASASRVRRLTTAEIEDAIERYGAGERIMTIAARLGVPRSRPRREFQARGITSKRTPLAEEQVEGGAELYRGGLSLATVGKELGATGMAIRRYLTERGATIRPRKGWENHLR